MKTDDEVALGVESAWPMFVHAGPDGETVPAPDTLEDPPSPSIPITA